VRERERERERERDAQWSGVRENRERPTLTALDASGRRNERAREPSVPFPPLHEARAAICERSASAYSCLRASLAAIIAVDSALRRMMRDLNVTQRALSVSPSELLACHPASS
jgi:hypothetical protein